ncbi:sensor histidine kinase [Streptomyces sp. NBC_00091]|uniref:sensor histidine kinase n=1 Tax=Streptomyces sp. NBC_00091 TaxID=2975648 RepID=UPI002251A8AA|nr:histidine kinase [Streptomyces sp. NBC_00091]MCX5376235.1 histidine kinase [Streptomyces sp. NBC_00091]
MPPSPSPSPSPSLRLQVNALQALCRQVFAVRLVMIPLGAPLALDRTARGVPTYLVGGSLLLTFMLSYVLYRDWERFGPLLLRHRWLLAADMAVGALLLITATPSSPLGLVALGTPLLAGLVYGWRGSAVFAAAQTVAVAALGGGLVLSLLCVLTGATGSSIRDFLFRLTETRARLAAAEAVREERERLAREMHDSVSKTLHGLALAADALARLSDPEAIRRQAELVSSAARRAASESRSLLTDLRHEEVSLLAGLRLLGADLHTSGALPALPPPVAHHLVSIASEAVENSRRHADASRIEVSVSVAAGETLTLTVEDDGAGLPSVVPPGHFGLLGMRERAAAIGAALSLGPRPAGPGTRVRLSLPLEGIR